MPNRTGQVLSHYRLEEKIGEGGMGVVYRAHNVRLDCAVAIKVLPDRTIEDDETRRRFHREAQRRSRLTHPTISNVHDFDTHDEVDFLVMELVPGETLHEKLRCGPLPEPQVLRLGGQLVAGMEAAHAQGIIHRDIKPQNLRIAADGTLKILDFGLAKLLHPSESDTTESLLQGGVGTLPYRAPEQFSGRVDERTDIYAAGTVLYEMSAGRRPFSADTAPQLMHAILHTSPVPPTRLNAHLSTAIERIILKAMDKDPERRYQSMREMRLDLERLQDPTQVAPPLPQPPKQHTRLWLAVTALALLALVLLLRGDRRTDPFPHPVLLPLDTSQEPWIECRLSPDGEWISYIGSSGGSAGLWMRRTAGDDSRPLLSFPGGVLSHVWSPDGERLALLVAREQEVLLQLVPAFGGPPVQSTRLENTFRGATLDLWAESSLYMDVSGDGLWRYDTGSASLVEILDRLGPNGESRTDFTVCAHENRVAYTVSRDGRLRVWVSDLSGANAAALTSGEANCLGPRWLGNDCRRLVYSSDRGGQLDLWGCVVARRAEAQISFSPGAELILDASRDGRALVISQREDRSHVWVQEPRAAAPRLRLTSTTSLDYWPSAAADGRLMAFQRRTPTLESADYIQIPIYLANRDSLGLTNLRLFAPDGGAVRLSPDGRWCAFLRRTKQGRVDLWMGEVDTGHAWVACERVLPSAVWPFPQEWLGSNLVWNPQGSSLFFVARGETGGQVIRRIDPCSGTAGSERLVAFAATWSVQDPQVSSDGQRLAYVLAPETEASQYEARTFDLATRQEATWFQWRPSGQGDLRCRGWRSGSGALVVLRALLNPDWTHQVEILAATPGGAPTLLGRVERAVLATTRYDPRSNSVFTTTADAVGVHNIHALLLDAGVDRTLTDNSDRGVSFSGVEILHDGKLLYTQQESNVSAWLIRFTEQAQKGRKPS